MVEKAILMAVVAVAVLMGASALGQAVSCSLERAAWQLESAQRSGGLVCGNTDDARYHCKCFK